jgi:hypothetical protein
MSNTTPRVGDIRGSLGGSVSAVPANVPAMEAQDAPSTLSSGGHERGYRENAMQPAAANATASRPAGHIALRIHGGKARF